MMKNIHTLKVAFGDTDAAGIVFYPNFYRWMDLATHEFIGVTVSPVSKLLKEEHIVFPLLETFCKFHSPLQFEDVIEIYTEVVDIKNKVFKVQHNFMKKDQLVASGYEVRAWTSTAGGSLKAVPIPEYVREAFIPEINE
ncbi:acyl-CoA thioesterase [Pseudogracilibacillus sp. SO30301A]|uniref:acyl-CoA thioesterase n=1 Tax=Pseudogracilibacillus sp. SO30301A TaxID=3098291 RepID=UPI00300E5F03